MKSSKISRIVSIVHRRLPERFAAEIDPCWVNHLPAELLRDYPDETAEKLADRAVIALRRDWLAGQILEYEGCGGNVADVLDLVRDLHDQAAELDPPVAA